MMFTAGTPIRQTRPRGFSIIAVAAVLSTLSGCATFDKNRNPETSPLVLDGTTVPEVNRISVPMPDIAPKAAPKRAEASSLWNSGTRSFFGDRRAKDVGDLLTVAININDQAQIKNASNRKRTDAQEADEPTFLGYGSQLEKILPGVDASNYPTSGKIVELGSTSSNSGSGEIKRNEKISLQIAALIIQVLPNGNFVIAGRQEVKVNQELRELRIAGIVRSVDISLDNTISYDKIAEARITYGGRGQISAVQQPRYGQDFLEIVLPY